MSIDDEIDAAAREAFFRLEIATRREEYAERSISYDGLATAIRKLSTRFHVPAWLVRAMIERTP